MFKKFFVAVILGLLVMSSQIVSAADIDWNSAPKIGSKTQLARYIENERRNGNTTFHIVLTYTKINNEEERLQFGKELVNRIVLPTITLSAEYGTGRGAFSIINESPGTRVANAYCSSDKYMAWLQLTSEEQQLYNIAVGIVDEANKRSSEVEKARFIHDEICKRVKKYQNENERDKTAIGALIDGYAQCQGYSDAFYMLGVMRGLNVSRIGGRINNNNGLHAWNTITFSDGRTYFVDVTNDDKNNDHFFFCAGKETMQQYLTCDWSIIPNLQ